MKQKSIKQLLFLTLIFLFCIEIRGSTTKTCSPPLDFHLFGDEATLVNGASFGQGFLEANSAIHFDGTDDYADFGTTNVGGVFSISFWTYWDSINNWSRVQDFSNGHQVETIAIGNYALDNRMVTPVYTPTDGNQIQTDQIITQNQWEQWVLIFNGFHDVEIFKNGSQVSTTFAAQNIPTGTTSIPNIARTRSYLGKFADNGQYFDGALEQYRFYERALTASEISCLSQQQSYCNRQCVSCSVSYDNCDSCIGNNRSTLGCQCDIGFYDDGTNDCQPMATSITDACATVESQFSVLSVYSNSVQNGVYFHFEINDVDSILRRKDWDGQEFDIRNLSTGEQKRITLYRTLQVGGDLGTGSGIITSMISTGQQRYFSKGDIIDLYPSNEYICPTCKTGYYAYKFRCILKQKTCSPPLDYLLYGDEATRLNGVSLGQGFLSSNTALQFDGVNDYCNFGTTRIGGDFSVSFWAKWESSNMWSRIMDFSNGNTAQNIAIANILTQYSFALALYTTNGGGYLSTNKQAENSIIQNEWAQWTLNFRTTEDIEVYKNGILIPMSIVSSTHTSGVPLDLVNRSNSYLGRSAWSTDGYFDGAIEQYRVYERLLTADEISCLSKTQSCNNLYHFGDYNEGKSYCKRECFSCSNGPDNCDTCVGNNRSTPSCLCDTGFYDDGTNDCQPMPSNIKDACATVVSSFSVLSVFSSSVQNGVYFHFEINDVDSILRRNDWDGQEFDIRNLSTGEQKRVTLYRTLQAGGDTGSGSGIITAMISTGQQRYFSKGDIIDLYSSNEYICPTCKTGQYAYQFRCILKQKTCTPPLDYHLYGDEATRVNGVSLGQGFLSSTTALQFDGVNDYCNFGTTRIGGDFSVSFWGKWESSNLWSRIMDFSNGSYSSNIAIANFLNEYSIGLALYTINGGGFLKTDKRALNTITQNEWAQWTFNFRTTEDIEIYKNGIPIIAENVSTTHTTGLPLEFLDRIDSFLGRSAWSGDGYFDGAIEQYRVYNRLLTTDEISCLSKTQSYCKRECFSCSNGAENCDSCVGNNRKSSNCLCEEGFYDNGTNDCQPMPVSITEKCTIFQNSFVVLSVFSNTVQNGVYFHFDMTEVDNILRKTDWDGQQFDIRNLQTGEQKTVTLYRSVQAGGDQGSASGIITSMISSGQERYFSVGDQIDLYSAGEYQCVSCQRNHIVQNGRCIPCASGEYSDISNTCQSCNNQNCGTCHTDPNTCIQPCHGSCKTCHPTGHCSTCELNEFVNGNICSLCDNTQCGTCTGSSTSCDIPCRSNCSDFCDTTGICNTCQNQFFKNSLNQQCEPCDEKCDRCSGSDTGCIACKNTILMELSNSCQCKSGSYYDNTTEDCECNPGSFKNGSGTCSLCDNSVCGTCSGNSTSCILDCRDNCTTCGIDGICDDCISEHFFNSSTQQCEPCDEKCDECTLSATGCSACKNTVLMEQSNNCLCKSGSYYDTTTKDCECNPGLYKDLSGSCSICDNSICGTCSGNSTSCVLDCRDNCTTCGIDGICDDCISQHFFNSSTQECETCDEKCDECTLTNTGCGACKNTVLMELSNSCQCKSGSYYDNIIKDCECNPGLYKDISGDCQPCDNSVCGTCSGSSSSCILDCRDNCTTCGIDGVCEDCISKHFFNSSTQQCEPCDDKCDDCSGSSTNCSSCKFPLAQDLSNGCACNEGIFDYVSKDCVCNPGTFRISDGTCKYCNQRICATCSGDADSCTDFCPAQCSLCDSEGNCTSCKLGQAVENNSCVDCSVKCSICDQNDKNICLQCSNEEGRSQNASDDCQCLEGFYENPIDLSCQKCSGYMCNQCDNTGECISCIDDSLIPPLCQKKNIPGKIVEIVEGKQVQESCSIKCGKCEISPENCISCNNSANRSQSLPSCPCLDGFHDNQGIQVECQKCPKFCATCLSENICVTCEDLPFISLNANSMKCECIQGYKEDIVTGGCLPCYQFNGECILECPLNTVVDEQNFSCIRIAYTQTNMIALILILGFTVILVYVGLHSFGTLFSKKIFRKPIQDYISSRK